MIILILWDMSETYSEPSDHWKLFFEIIFSKTSTWKWVKIRLLVYCDIIKAFTTFLSPETKSLDAYGQSIWRFQSHSSSALQILNTDDFEGYKFSTKISAETSEEMRKLMPCDNTKIYSQNFERYCQFRNSATSTSFSKKVAFSSFSFFPKYFFSFKSTYSKSVWMHDKNHSCWKKIIFFMRQFLWFVTFISRMLKYKFKY